MTKLVRQHHICHLIQRTHSVEIIYTTAAVGVAIGHDDDVVAGGGANGIVQLEEPHGHQVAVGPEGIITGTHQTLHVEALAGVSDARFLTREGNAPHVEVVSARGKRFLP
jgi:hypothetical protein